MSAIAKAGFSYLKNLVKGVSVPKTTKAINFVKPAVHKSKGAQKLSETYIDIGKQRGKMKRSFQKMEEYIDPARKKLRNTLQKMDNKPVTESGFNKGKNLAKGGRVGLSKGSGFPDYSGDGKITMKDVLMGRGVIPKKKGKKKMMAKKTETPMQKAVKKNKKKII